MALIFGDFLVYIELWNKLKFTIITLLDIIIGYYLVKAMNLQIFSVMIH